MRAVRALTGGFAYLDRPALAAGTAARGRGAGNIFRVRRPGCVTGLLLATLASFVVYLPVTALVLNGGKAIAADGPAPVLTTKAQIVLMGLWTATAWAGAALAAVAG